MKNEKLPSYGGQALIEGVLMRGSKSLAAAMRSPDGTIVIESEELTGIYKGKIKDIPFVRGIIALWDALGLGMRYLTISANLQAGTDEQIKGSSLLFTLTISILLAILLFFVAPAALAHWIQGLLNINSWISNLIEGVIRLLLILGYIFGIGKIPEISRVFAYHGAEHKTINAFEAGSELTPEKVQEYSVIHPRCGTSFLVTLVILSIILFSFLGPLNIQWRLISRILLLPVLAGISYEYIKWTALHMDKSFIKILIYPNLKLQYLTTREPDTGMLEVAISSFTSMMNLEKSTVL